MEGYLTTNPLQHVRVEELTFEAKVVDCWFQTPLLPSVNRYSTCGSCRQDQNLTQKTCILLNSHIISKYLGSTGIQPIQLVPSDRWLNSQGLPIKYLRATPMPAFTVTWNTSRTSRMPRVCILSYKNQASKHYYSPNYSPEWNKRSKITKKKRNLGVNPDPRIKAHAPPFALCPTS